MEDRLYLSIYHLFYYHIPSDLYIYLPKEFKELVYVIMEVDESQDLQEAKDPEEQMM